MAIYQDRLGTNENERKREEEKRCNNDDDDDDVSMSDYKWSPDGSQLVLVSTPRDHKAATVRLANAETGKRVEEEKMSFSFVMFGVHLWQRYHLTRRRQARHAYT